ncbi:zinc finger MYM-type protein 1-like [Zingiber officinale]|uniref:zinc finger MYM-type protein 1-like n=1 Tax=Zingiber officinale TaxID=94328 RepID=UPI001C4D16C3|nr:zinc finger MYM-type protein 1-like [Zingiber officinale]
MHRFFKRKTPEPEEQNIGDVTVGEFDFSQLPADPGLRIPICSYNANIRDQVRRRYLQKGPCQPSSYEFPKRKFGVSQFRRFNPSWFKKFGDWLEYSIEKDAAYCLYCYLFKTTKGKQAGGETFVSEGFTNWKGKDRLYIHVGQHDSEHHKARMNCEALMNQDEHIQSILHKQSKQMRNDYRIRLNASIDCIRVLLRQGNSFRGHDETEGSLNPGNFLILLEFLGAHNKEINDVILKNVPKNCKLTSPDIQKDIVRACATETINVIIKDIGNSLFSILVDESRDVSMKEQMSVVLRYVDSSGHVNERFIGIEHVTSTTALSLKAAIDKMFSKYNLSIANVRGQGFDGASNMQGKFNGLKALILKENPCAFYIHCFAHQLQLALIAVAKKNLPISNFFRIVGDVVNVVGSSCKRSDLLKEKHSDFIVEALESGEISSGRGLNQETTLQRAGDTRWGSHYNSLISLISMFSAIIDVLEVISEDDSSSPDQKTEAFNLLESILSFDFAFNLHLMKHVLGISSELSTALQKKDQDIVNAMDLVQVCKHRLQNMREDGWDSFLEKVHYFCQQHYIDCLKMDDMFTRWAPRGRPHRNPLEVTNLHHYRVDLFYGVIDMQLQELNDRFSEASTELLLCVACLCPQNSFLAFDKKKLLQLAEFYPQDFSRFDLLVLDDQLETYICDMRSNKTFQGLKGLGDLSEKLVMSKKNMVYPLVFKLLTLALILPVATATVERVFSAMRIVKDRLRNRMSDDWMNDSLIVYVEKDIFLKVDNEAIIQKFQNMKTRKEQL